MKYEGLERNLFFPGKLVWLEREVTLKTKQNKLTTFRVNEMIIKQ